MVHDPFKLLCFWAAVVAAVAVAMAATGAGRAQAISPPVWTVPRSAHCLMMITAASCGAGAT